MLLLINWRWNEPGGYGSAGSSVLLLWRRRNRR